MKNSYLTKFAAMGAILASVIASSAQSYESECQYAVERYNRAFDEIPPLLRRYANCISESRGRDDCSFEFRRLRSAQTEFELAVSNRRSECG